MKLIMTDQLRGDALHCMGNEAGISPHIDQLAQEGTLFTSGYTSAPSSTPARAGLLTGMSPWHHVTMACWATVGLPGNILMRCRRCFATWGIIPLVFF